MHKRYVNLDQHANLRTAQMHARITVHNCRTHCSTEQFWLFSVLTSRQSPSLRCCLLEGRGVDMVTSQWDRV